ncbi:prolyl oligopeptidase family serine peptidase [Rhodococcus sp. X156]|uniref:S9 family peptidase n=1 Tax=Rhodococcus sp. X156 TaxID=2499145 RepID=UPI000FDC1043|nr:prolyl oligopeptidase family serine peptidase [Rhodococcus sp. X156]
MTKRVRFTSHASLSPDATAFACIVDEGGYPRAEQRFLSGRTTTHARWVELPVSGPITKVIHSADGRWLACQMAPDGATRTQVWVVTTDPDDRAARRLGTAEDCSMELAGWDGTRVAVTAIDADGVAEARLVDPHTQAVQVLDRRRGGHLVDSWDGTALLRVGPRGDRELLMLRGGAALPLLPRDPGSTTDVGILLDERHSPGRPEKYRWNGPDQPPARRRVRALVRSDHGCEHARLLEVALWEGGGEAISWRVLAERADCDLDEFVVSDDSSTVALLWNVGGVSELQVLDLADGHLHPPVDLPGLVAADLSVSAGGSMLAVTVQGPSMPPSVALVEPRTGEWGPLEPVDPAPVPVHSPVLCELTAADGTPLSGWLYRSAHSGPGPVLLYFHGGPEAQERPTYSELYPALVDAGVSVFAPNVRGSGGFGRTFVHADEGDKRFAGIDDVADCVAHLVAEGVADPARVACAGRSYGGYLTLASLTFHSELFAAGVAICGMSSLASFYENTEPWIAEAAYPKYGHPVRDRQLLEELSPISHIAKLTAPLLVVHGAHDTNVPVSESEQVVAAVQRQGGRAELLLFPDEGHEIVTRVNRAALVDAVVRWVTQHAG